MVSRRAALIAACLTTCAGGVAWWLGERSAALVLTASAAVAIINGLWLEGALARVLQPGQPRFSLASVLQLTARWVLWGVFFAVLFALRSHVEGWAVAVGIGCYVIALASAGLVQGAGEAPAERRG